MDARERAELLNERQLTQEEKIKQAVQILSKVSLPVIPSEVIWLEEALRDQNTNFFDIIKKTETQSGLVEEVIQTANQVLVRFDNPVTTIHQAINFLGANSLYYLVVSAYLKKLYGHNRTFEIVLEHSIWTAKAMTIIERQFDHQAPEYAYSLGLFHNIGALVLSLHDTQKYDKFFQQSRSFPLTALRKEESRYGTNHCVLGVIVGKKWKLPKTMLECVYRHHSMNLSNLPSREIQHWIAKLRLANGLVDQVCYQVYRTGEIRTAEEEALAYLGLTIDQFQKNKNQFVKFFMKR